jgi:hypothetical protein
MVMEEQLIATEVVLTDQALDQLAAEALLLILNRHKDQQDLLLVLEVMIIQDHHNLVVSLPVDQQEQKRHHHLHHQVRLLQVVHRLAVEALLPQDQPEPEAIKKKYMNIKKLILAAIIVIAAQNSYAQYLTDALRFSRFESGTTARFDALGGTKSAIGGDLSSLYGNPAGLGMFSKSEFNLTPSLSLRNNDITANGNNISTSNNNLNLNNLGIVLHGKAYKNKDLTKGLISYSFGIGYQTRNNFQNNFNYNLTTNSNGLGDYFAGTATAENSTPQNFVSNLNFGAYNSFLINQRAGSQRIYDPITITTAKQNQMVNRSGISSSVNLVAGLNISNKVFLGANVGLSSFRYSSIENTQETGIFRDPTSGNDFNYDVDYIRNFSTEGSGINLKIGAIVKPTNELRIGLSVESPTWFNVTDNYSEQLVNNIDNIDETDNYPFDYNLNTPLKIEGGMAYFFGSNGFISADIGYVDYSSIKFNSGNSNVDIENNRDIKSTFTNTINFNVGGEIKLNTDYLARLGYNSQGDPYLNGNNQTINTYSGGLGYRSGAYYLDLGYNYRTQALTYSNYQLNGNRQPISNIDIQKSNVSLTFGVRF